MKRQDNFLQEFERVRKAIEDGVTPVYSELRSVKTTLKELIPSIIIQSILLVVSTTIVSQIQMSELTSLVIILVVNSTTQALSFSLLSLLKHFVRKRKLRKYGLEINEKNIAVLESMEYQSV